MSDQTEAATIIPDENPPIKGKPLSSILCENKHAASAPKDVQINIKSNQNSAFAA
ncbi:MAG: hypothetical protein IJ706_09430 [Clostridia bacterium]|nr:hypothetical protein [Clostridia bacterium]MBR1677513.1 hypothetical protein [Clostridia bacterium]